MSETKNELGCITHCSLLDGSGKRLVRNAQATAIRKLNNKTGGQAIRNFLLSYNYTALS